MEQGFVVQHSPGCLVAQGADDGSPFIARERFGTERPSGAYDKVAGDAEFVGLVESHREHVDPFVTQPYKGLAADSILGAPREGDGVDLHTGDACLLE